MRYLLAALAAAFAIVATLSVPFSPPLSPAAFERAVFYPLPSRPAAPLKVAHAPQPNYNPNDWVYLGVAANLDGVLTFCDKTTLYPNKTHERITRRMLKVGEAIDKSDRFNQVGWQMVNQLLQIGQGARRHTLLPDPRDGGVRLDPEVFTEIRDEDACKAAEVDARKLMEKDAILDIEGVDDGDGV